MNLEAVKLHRRVKNILISFGWEEGRKLVLALQKYKLMSEDLLLDKLIKKHSRLVPKSFISSLTKSDEYKEIENRYNVLIYSSAEGDTIVVMDVYSDIDMTTLNFEIERKGKLFPVYVLPRVMEELLGNLSPYDPTALLKLIMHDALEQGVSDVHFSVRATLEGELDYYYQYRIGEEAEDINTFQFDKNLNGELINETITRLSKGVVSDLKSDYGVVASALNIFGDGTTSLRIGACQVNGGYMMVVRIVPLKFRTISIDQLGFPQDIQDDLEDIARRRSGLTLFTGARRTGKNTTSFALSNRIKEFNLVRVDISSPLESLSDYPQIDFNADENKLLNMSKLVKKMDVDIVFLNELPSKEIASAIKDLVYSSMHVITTFHIDRLWHLPYKMEEYFGESIKSMLSQMNFCTTQKMFDKQCPHCQSTISTDSAPRRFKEFIDQYNITHYYKSTGCDQCIGGFMGFQPYLERLVFTNSLKSELLKAEKPYQMEEILKRELFRLKNNMEEYVVSDIKKGILTLTDLDKLL